MSTPTEKLTAQGVSIWLDDLSRVRITSGSLAELIETRNVSGVTTNPTIFAGALSHGHVYEAQVAQLAAAGVSTDDAIFQITTDDVRDATDIFRGVYDATDGVDGRVSIEVSPDLAHDTAATIEQAKQLWATVDRPNAHIKIPATKAGLPAITATLAEGISVNVTLIFSLQRYAEVIDAFLSGIEQAKAAGHDISKIHSVASFFVSRVDTEVDKRLAAIGTPEAEALTSKAGVANARLAYELFEKEFATDRAKALTDAGAHVQRPLWASTGVKDPSLPDTLYVTELVAPGTVNTMPEKTLEATFDHGEIGGDAVTGAYADAHAVFDRLASVGVDFDDVTQVLEDEGVEKFIASWHELKDTVKTALLNAPEIAR
ncbi:transaldolase [Microbacterium deminutum]|uniref:Transaldolase n=1 Tax=Microbacterium deminutum TaxID=344164 RepID=A0ABN2QCS9_9MICO